MITLRPASEDQRELWRTLLDLAEESKSWTLIGARMVELHAWNSGRTMIRTSRDADALADARQRPNPVRQIAEILIAKDFHLASTSVFGTGHEFKRGNIEIDVLAPEHLGDHSEEARTTVPPFHTVEVPGGTQALHRTSRLDVQLQERTGVLPCPDLLGAILIKARAIRVDQRPDDQRRDLALLLSLVTDPRPWRGQLSAAERGWLRDHPELDDERAPFWRELGPEATRDGLSAYRFFTETQRPPRLPESF